MGLGLLYVEYMFPDPTGEIEPRRAAAAREVAIRAGGRGTRGVTGEEEKPPAARSGGGRVHRNSAMSKRQGPPKHQNRYAWKPNLGQKINETVSPLPPLVPLPSPNLSIA